MDHRCGGGLRHPLTSSDYFFPGLPKNPKLVEGFFGSGGPLSDSLTKKRLEKSFFCLIDQSRNAGN